MNKKVVVIGAGGHGRVVADIISNMGDQVLGFLDDDPHAVSSFGIPLLGGVSDFKRFLEAEFVVAIGSALTRERVVNQLNGVTWYTAIHPSAIISLMGTDIGEGTVVMAGAVVNPGVRIGRHCIVNTGAVIDHDSKVGDFVHVSVGAKLAGTVTVGNRTWIGIGSVVSNGLAVCGDCLIGAGAVVIKNLEEPGTYVGVPVRRIH